MKRLRKTVGNLTIVILLLVLAAVTFYDRFGTPPFSAIPSRSMLPALQVGDLVLSVPTKPSEINKGDIIIVTPPELVKEKYNYPSRIVHRVHKIIDDDGRRLFITKGDNNKGQDPFIVTPKMIQGEVVESFRYLGYIILFLNSPQGKIFLAASATVYVLFLLYEFYRNRRRTFRKKLVSAVFGELFQRTDQLERQQQENTEQIIDILRQAKLESVSATENHELPTLRQDVNDTLQLVEQVTSMDKDEQNQLLEQLQSLKKKLTPIKQTDSHKTDLVESFSEKIESVYDKELVHEHNPDLTSTNEKEHDGLEISELPPRRKKHRKKKIF